MVQCEPNDMTKFKPELLSTLIRFKAFKVAWIADITKAFRQIELTEEDAEVGRFFWFEDPFDPNLQIICYRFRVVPFGLTCSFFILRAIIQKHIKLYENINPETAVNSGPTLCRRSIRWCLFAKSRN